jgi:hypothetical protein
MTLARKLHEWYLEATKSLNPESYNPNAQKSYDDLTAEQKYIDNYIADETIAYILSLLPKEEPLNYAGHGDIYWASEQERKRIRNELLADIKERIEKEMGNE